MKNRKLKTAVFVPLSLLFGLVAGELTLQCLSSIFPQVEFVLSKVKPVSYDDEGRVLPNPRHPEHDRLGFRNEAVPEEVDLLLMGDSQVYGTSVAREENFAAQLESNCGMAVYNMALPSYSPPYDLLNCGQAVQFHPKAVLAALYSGNDLYGAYAAVHEVGLLPELKPDDQDKLRELEESEEQTPFLEEVSTVARFGQSPVGGSLREWVSQHSRVYGALRSFKSLILGLGSRPINSETEWADHKASALNRMEGAIVVEEAEARTVLTPLYRSFTVNLEDIRISEGLRICLESLARMREKWREEGVRFAVLLIPTKEFVFEDFFGTRNADTPEEYASFCRSEEKVWEEVKTFLDREGIDYLDLKEGLSEALSRGECPYLPSWDGHPNISGHKAIAERIAHFLGLDCFESDSSDKS